MKSRSLDELNTIWARHNAEWRDSAQITSQWQEAAETDPKLLHHRVKGDWWGVLEQCEITLLVTREYEHLVMALQVSEGRPLISYLRLPHPSGLVVDRTHHTVHIASTRNPNQIYALKPIKGVLPRLDISLDALDRYPLVPVASRFLPGCLYMHDLALIQGELYANAVGHNAIVRFKPDGGYERVWWPHCIETDDGPVFGQNHIQLNSIAAGVDLKNSYFSASADKLSARRPGHLNFPVDKRGVIFSGATREPIVRGLTRPHSARLQNETLWVDNSGYGEVGVGLDGRFVPVLKLPGWTRGLCFHGTIAFVGTSRVIPRFRQYAPGLDVDASVCGIHAIDTQSGQLLGSLIWPQGNQIFALDWLKNQVSTGLPFLGGGKRPGSHEKHLFYAFQADEI